MSKYTALIKRASNATAAIALTLASLTPAVMLGSSAKAAQLTSRSIDMSSSLADATGVSYTVGFTPTSAYQWIVIEFCENSPIIGATCEAPSTMDLDSVTLTNVTGGTGTWADDGSTTTKIKFEASASQSTAAKVLTIGDVRNPADIDASGGSPSIGNQIGTFYARILTYSSDPEGAGGTTPGSYVDYGGIALSTTADVTINARVQEQLTFCVGSVLGSTDFSLVNSCTAIDDSVVDLGVVSTADAISPVPESNTGNDKVGAFLVSTNAISGVKVSYTSPHSLRAAVVDCENDDLGYLDQCFNSQSTGLATLNTAFTGGQVGESFGMKIESITENGEAEAAGLTATAPYDASYAWNTTAEAEIASSLSVVDTEVAEIFFGARAKATTPTGSYSTSANFVATATF